MEAGGGGGVLPRALGVQLVEARVEIGVGLSTVAEALGMLAHVRRGRLAQRGDGAVGAAARALLVERNEYAGRAVGGMAEQRAECVDCRMRARAAGEEVI